MRPILCSGVRRPVPMGVPSSARASTCTHCGSSSSHFQFERDLLLFDEDDLAHRAQLVEGRFVIDGLDAEGLAGFAVHGGYSSSSINIW
jgi:hypothetical protein